MGALSFALPFSALLYLLPSVPNVPDLGKAATTVAEQLNNLIGVIGVPKEIYGDNGEIEIEPKFLDGSLDPLGIITPIIDSLSDGAKVNVGFQTKVESRKDRDRVGISTNVQLANQAKWSRGVILDEHKASKELSIEEERTKSASSKESTTDGNAKDAAVLRLYIPDISDALREKFARTSMKLGLDVATKKDADGSKTDARRRNFIRLCRRLNDGPTASLMQKLYGKICVKLPRSEFYLEQGTRMPSRKDGTTRFVGLKIGTKTSKDYKDLESGSDESKQRGGGTTDVIETSISDGSINYDESSAKIADTLGTGLNIKMPLIESKIGNLLRNNKLSLSAALKV